MKGCVSIPVWGWQCGGERHWACSQHAGWEVGSKGGDRVCVVVREGGQWESNGKRGKI